MSNKKTKIGKSQQPISPHVEGIFIVLAAFPHHRTGMAQMELSQSCHRFDGMTIALTFPGHFFLFSCFCSRSIYQAQEQPGNAFRLVSAPLQNVSQLAILNVTEAKLTLWQGAQSARKK